MSSDVVEAIRHRRKPVFERDDERLVYELVTEMKGRARWPNRPTIARSQCSGSIIDRTDHLVGFYTMVAIMLNGFDAPAPGGERPLP